MVRACVFLTFIQQWKVRPNIPIQTSIAAWINNPLRRTSERSPIYITRVSAHIFLFSYILRFRGVKKKI